MKGAIMAWSDLPSKPNILLIITDQQRAAQHWPDGWVAEHLPSLQRLLNNGMSFANAFTAACECSPSRAAFLTSTYDNTNGIFHTGPKQPLTPPPGLPNLGSLMVSAGYEVVWKGKWHVSGGSSSDSLVPYGFTGWDPPQAGVTMTTQFLGGGSGPTNDNDHRYVTGAIEFLQNRTSAQPFFLVVSLANPHDVHVYAKNAWPAAGYPETIPDLGIGSPPNCPDPLTDKPTVQHVFRKAFNKAFPIEEPGTDAGYANFYAYLQTVVDAQIVRLLDALDSRGLTNNTLIVRMGDHGEMGMSHGLREKMYNAYEETIHVPLIFSNPIAFPESYETFAMASLLDLVPTLAAVAGAPSPRTLRGKDLTPVLANYITSVQNGVLFSYDDSAFVSTVQFASNIRALRKIGWMYAVYFNQSEPTIPLEFELYNLKDDSGQMVNLLSPSNYKPSILPQWQSLNDELWRLADRLNSTPPGFIPPSSSALGPDLLDLAASVATPVEDLVLDLEGK
jgi:arylsulfatase A-like enzyme